jgi:hypothetical protein
LRKAGAISLGGKVDPQQKRRRQEHRRHVRQKAIEVASMGRLARLGKLTRISRAEELRDASAVGRPVVMVQGKRNAMRERQMGRERHGGTCLKVKLSSAGAWGGERASARAQQRSASHGRCAETAARHLSMLPSGLSGRTKANLLVSRARCDQLAQRAEASAQWSARTAKWDIESTRVQSDRPSSLLCHLYKHRTRRPRLFERTHTRRPMLSTHMRQQTRQTKSRLCRIVGKANASRLLIGLPAWRGRVPVRASRACVVSRS